MPADVSIACPAPPRVRLASARAWTRPALVLIPALVAFAFFLVAPQVLGDGDTWWHLKAGQWMLQHHAVPRTDPFTFTYVGRPWHAHEWLAEVLLAAAYGLGGWSGAVVLGGAAFAAAFGVMARALNRRLEPAHALLALALTAGCLAPGLLLRPHLFSTPLLAAWTVLLLDARRRGGAPSPAWALLVVLWVNLHASVVFALALIVPFALEALIERRADPWPVVRGWGVFGLAALAAGLVSPFGLDGLLFPLQVASMPALGSIVEWRPLDLTRLQPAEVAFAVGLAALLYRRPRVPLTRVVVLLTLVWMTLAHQRHQVLLGVVGVLIVADALGRSPTAGARPKAEPAIAAAVLALAIAALRLSLPIVRADAPTAPAAALAHAPRALRGQPVFNDYGMGGYLIFQGVRPYIDGRTDMYDAAFDRAYTAAANGDRAALDASLAERHIAWTILSPSSGAARVLDGEPGWRRLYADRFAVIHVRRP